MFGQIVWNLLSLGRFIYNILYKVQSNFSYVSFNLPYYIEYS